MTIRSPDEWNVRRKVEAGGMVEGSSRYTVYFYAQFSKPLKDYGVWSVDIPAAGSASGIRGESGFPDIDSERKDFGETKGI